MGWPMSNLSYNDISKSCFKRGSLSVLASARSYYGQKDEEVQRIGRQLALNPDLMKDFYDELSTGDKIALFKFSKDAGGDLYSNKYWRKYIDDSIAAVSDVGPSIVYGRENGEELILMLEQKEDGDLSKVFRAVIQRYEEARNNWVSEPANKLFNLMLERDPDLFQSDTFELFFDRKSKAPYDVRGRIYNLYARNGFLTKKTARKVRSDASAAASVGGLKGLIDARDSENCPYSSVDVLNMILQFTDSRYEDVIVTLADGLPVHLLPSIMGTDFAYAKRIMERRINESMKED